MKKNILRDIEKRFDLDQTFYNSHSNSITVFCKDIASIKIPLAAYIASRHVGIEYVNFYTV